MNYPKNRDRRYSVLMVPGGASNTIRPRSGSTSILGVYEGSTGLGLTTDRRPSATPCFVSPRMAFTTQFSYDSPIQILTCNGGSRVLKPVSKWRSRWSHTSLSRSTKATLLFIFCTALYFLMRGNPESTQQSGHQCDPLHPNAHCHSAQGFDSPLQVFLRNASADRLAVDSHQTSFGQDPTHLSDGHEVRSYKPRMITVQGQYERTDHDLGIGNGFGKSNSTLTSGEVTSHDKNILTDNEELQIAREVSRADKFVAETETNAELNQSDGQPPINFLERNLALTPQHPATWQHKSLPEASPQELVSEEALPGDEETLHVQHGNLGQKNYHREQEFISNEVQHREVLRRRQQEELWQEQRRQPQHPHQSSSGSGMEQWDGPTSPVGVPQREEFGVLDRRHPAWRDARLPRGVSPRRYYMHPDL